MNGLDSILFSLMFFFLAALLLWYAFGARRVLIGAALGALYCIVLGISVPMRWYRVFALMLFLPLGGIWIAIALYRLSKPLRYRVKGEGLYIQPIYYCRSTHYRSLGVRYYKLECKYRADGKRFKLRSDDNYSARIIRKKYTPGETIPIWIHRKDPSRFVVNRFDGMVLAFLPLALGICTVYFAVRVIFKLY